MQQARRQQAGCAVCLLALAVAACAWAAAPPAAPSTLSPLLAWSNRGIIGTKGKGLDMSYEVADACAVAGSALLAALGKGSSSAGLLGGVVNMQGLAEEKLDVVVLFVGSQLDGASVRSSEQLERTLQAARSSIVLPYTHWEGQDAGRSLHAALLAAAGAAHQAFGCQGSSTDLASDVQHALQQALQQPHGPGQQQQQPRLLVVCAGPASLQEELGLVAAVQSVLDQQQGAASLVVYATQRSSSSSSGAAHGRSLLGQGGAGFGPYAVCGKLCQTQVQWLEGMLVFLFMALAAGAGFLCLSGVGTPSRFEKAREAQ